MKDFEKIDWNKYNKPPYYQQWLCRGDTKKLAVFGDEGLAEVDDQILALKDQWDLDNANGHFLDRIGKLLDISRNGYSDEYYRILLKLKRAINTNSGSVNDIIRVIKFYYSNEIIEIKPNYPAGISILHDGEGPIIDFNRIMIQVIGAGIAYDTKELFNFIEELLIREQDKKVVRNIVKDSVSQLLLRNGRIPRDGKTVFDTQVDFLFRNGSVTRNNSTSRNGVHKVPAVGTIVQPVYRYSGIQDTFVMGFKEGNYFDAPKSFLYRNAAVIRDGTVTRTGFTSNSMNDTLQTISTELWLSDTGIINDQHETTVKLDAFDIIDSIDDLFFAHYSESNVTEILDISDDIATVFLKLWLSDTMTITDQYSLMTRLNVKETIGRNIPRNGRYGRNEKLYRSSDRIVDPFTSNNYTEPNITDDFEITDDIVAGLKYHYFRDKTLNRNGSVQRKGMIFIPLE